MDEKTIVKRTVKDSVFTDLFGMPKYLMQMYQTLHPEDTTTTIDDIRDVTLRNILSNALYNDLGFRVGDRLLVMVECQSSWSVNIVIRALQYIIETYGRYMEEKQIDLYTGRKAVLPRPELYVIYTGDRKECPEYISLKDDFFEGEDIAIDAKIKVIRYNGHDRDIISQYIAFTRIVDEQIAKYGRTIKALEEAIRICNDRDILKEYLLSRRSEIMDIYTSLFDQEVVYDRHLASEKRISEEIGEKRGVDESVSKLAKHYVDENPELSLEEATAMAEKILR